MRLFHVLLLTALMGIAASGGALAGVIYDWYYVDWDAPGPTHDGTSWNYAFLTIQEGIDAASSGDEVWVAEGEYVENIEMEVNVAVYGGFEGDETSRDQRDYQTNVTTIDGDESGSCVTMANGARIDGFTISNGTGTLVGASRNGGGIYCRDLDEGQYDPGYIENNIITGNTANLGAGGGIYCYGSSPDIVACTISENYADGGGGIYAYHYSDPQIRDSAILENETVLGGAGGGIAFEYHCDLIIDGNHIEGNVAMVGGGIFCDRDCDATIVNNDIVGNSTITIDVFEAHGGGICLVAASVRTVISGNVIENNTAHDWGGGIFLLACDDVTINNNTIEGNIARRGGGLALHASYGVIDSNIVAHNVADDAPFSVRSWGGGLAFAGRAEGDAPWVLTNNVVIYNVALVGTGQGGGIHCHAARVTLTNNTIAANSADYGCGLACDHDQGQQTSVVVLTNCILWDCGNNNEVYNHDNSTLTITYSDVQGDWTGQGNIDDDPLFVDPGDDDFHIQAGSPCVDVGDNDAAVEAELDYDFEGDPRIYDGDGDCDAVVDMGADEYAARTLTSPPQGWFGIGWNFFSIPLEPVGSAEASELLGYDVENILYALDRVQKTYLLYPDDFTDLEPGDGYKLILGESIEPDYEGWVRGCPFESSLPEIGWSWVGHPFDADLLLERVQVRNESTQEVRDAWDDYDAPASWVNWNWMYMVAGSSEICALEAGDDDTLHPWYGYHVWSYSDELTLIFPSP